MRREAADHSHCGQAIGNLVGADHGVGTTKGPSGDGKLFDGKVFGQCGYIVRPIQQLTLGLEIR
jgi:hypothetical protein